MNRVGIHGYATLFNTENALDETWVNAESGMARRRTHVDHLKLTRRNQRNE